MFVISKKRLSFILGIVIVFLFSIIIANEKINIDTSTTIETVALPVTNKVIVIDARTWNTR